MNIRINSICSDIACDIEKARYVLEDLDEHTYTKQTDVYSFQKNNEEANICVSILCDYLSKILEEVNEISAEIDKEEEKSEQDEKHQKAE